MCGCFNGFFLLSTVIGIIVLLDNVTGFATVSAVGSPLPLRLNPWETGLDGEQVEEEFCLPVVKKIIIVKWEDLCKTNSIIELCYLGLQVCLYP